MGFFLDFLPPRCAALLDRTNLGPVLPALVPVRLSARFRRPVGPHVLPHPACAGAVPLHLAPMHGRREHAIAGRGSADTRAAVGSFSSSSPLLSSSAPAG